MKRGNNKTEQARTEFLLRAAQLADGMNLNTLLKKVIVGNLDYPVILIFIEIEPFFPKRFQIIRLFGDWVGCAGSGFGSHLFVGI